MSSDWEDLDVSPKAFWREVRHWLPTAIGVIVILGLIFTGIGFAANWFGNTVQTVNTRHTAQVIQHGLGAQSADISQFENYAQQLTPAVRQVQADKAPGGQAAFTASDVSSAREIGQQMCALVLKVDDPPKDMAAWGKANCLAGALSLGSPLEKL